MHLASKNGLADLPQLTIGERRTWISRVQRRYVQGTMVELVISDVSSCIEPLANRFGGGECRYVNPRKLLVILSY